MLVLLVYVLCVRFDCRDMQTVVNVLRNIMQSLRAQHCPSNAEYIVSILRWFHAWQDSLHEAPWPNTAEACTTVLRRLGLCSSFHGVCNAMLYDTQHRFTGTLCPKQAVSGGVWCEDHSPVRRDPADTYWMGGHDMIGIPADVPCRELDVVGYFENQWESLNGWRCSLDTMRHHLQRTPTVIWPCVVSTVRLYGFERRVQNAAAVLGRLIQPDMWRTLLTRDHILLPGARRPARSVVAASPLRRGSVGAVRCMVSGRADPARADAGATEQRARDRQGGHTRRVRVRHR